MNQDPAAWRRLSETIRAHRVRNGWSQAELAQRAGISTKSALTAESGKPPSRMPPSIPRIAEALGWADGSIDTILDGGAPVTFVPPGAGKTEVVTKAVQQAIANGQTVLVTSAKGDVGGTGRLIASLRQATEFSRICAEMGADPAALTQFDAAAEALLSSAVTAQARSAGLTQEHFAAVAHSPRSDGGPDSDRAVVDDVVRKFRAERHEE